MKRFPIIITVAIAIALALPLAGCGLNAGSEDFTTTSYKTLKSAEILYDEGLTALGDAYRLGLIGDDEKASVIDAANAYRAAYLAAADALYAYSLGDTDQQDVSDKLLAFQRFYQQFSLLIRPYLIRSLSDS